MGVRPGEVSTLQITFERALENLLLCMSLLPFKAELSNRNEMQGTMGHFKISSSHMKKVKIGALNFNHFFIQHV